MYCHQPVDDIVLVAVVRMSSTAGFLAASDILEVVVDVIDALRMLSAGRNCSVLLAVVKTTV
jgi:hypothetical protein